MKDISKWKVAIHQLCFPPMGHQVERDNFGVFNDVGYDMTRLGNNHPDRHMVHMMIFQFTPDFYLSTVDHFRISLLRMRSSIQCFSSFK